MRSPLAGKRVSRGSGAGCPWGCLARRWDGSFLYQNQAGDGDSDSYTDHDTTASFLLTYSLPQHKLFCTGKGSKPANALTGAELQAVLDSGKSFEAGRLRVSYEQKNKDELLESLGSWAPTVRYRAANALAKTPEKPIRQLIAMLDSKDLNRRYGACYALECIGGPSAPAVDALIAQLSHADSWLQIRAAYALSAIGPRAHKAVPVMFKMVVTGTPNEPRENARNYIGMALFSGRLFGGSLDDVDKTLLLPSIKVMLATDLGQARGQVAKIYSKLSEKELNALWPDILRAANKNAPTGEMYSDEIRLESLRLMAEHHIKEGLRAGIDYAKHQNSWDSQDRMPEIMKSVALYGTAAQGFLPELRELVDTFRKEEFPDEPKKVKIAALQAGIKQIETAKETPPLRSLAPAKGK